MQGFIHALALNTSGIPIIEKLLKLSYRFFSLTMAEVNKIMHILITGQVQLTQDYVPSRDKFGM